jgi:hypothetical protein
MHLLRNSLVVASLFTMAAFAQITTDSPFQVRYAGNLSVSDSYVNITNTGAIGADLASNSAGTADAAARVTGAICANVYVFSPDEQMISCCSCPVTPNGLVSLSARNDLISNTLTPAVPTAIVVKVLGSRPTRQGSNLSCNGSAAAPGEANIVPGLVAWGTSIHAGPTAGAFFGTETQFAPAALSAGEFNRLTQLCTFINANGSGYGLCRSCRLGALGGSKN